MEIDHVLIAVTDLAVASRELEEHHGLASIEGGRHPGWGTANRIVPLGDTYLELAAVVDKNVAVQTAFGRWVAGEDSQPRLLGWAVRTDDLEPVARRLNLNIEDGSRTHPQPGRAAVAASRTAFASRTQVYSRGFGFFSHQDVSSLD